MNDKTSSSAPKHLIANLPKGEFKAAKARSMVEIPLYHPPHLRGSRSEAACQPSQPAASSQNPLSPVNADPFLDEAPATLTKDTTMDAWLDRLEKASSEPTTHSKSAPTPVPNDQLIDLDFEEVGASAPVTVSEYPKNTVRSIIDDMKYEKQGLSAHQRSTLDDIKTSLGPVLQDLPAKIQAGGGGLTAVLDEILAKLQSTSDAPDTAHNQLPTLEDEGYDTADPSGTTLKDTKKRNEEDIYTVAFRATDHVSSETSGIRSHANPPVTHTSKDHSINRGIDNTAGFLAVADSALKELIGSGKYGKDTKNQNNAAQDSSAEEEVRWHDDEYLDPASRIISKISILELTGR